MGFEFENLVKEEVVLFIRNSVRNIELLFFNVLGWIFYFCIFNRVMC